MDPQLFKYGVILFTWIVSIPGVAIMAGVFAYKCRKGWAALGITVALQLPFAVIFPDVYFHNASMPGIASIAVLIVTPVATSLFGLFVYPFVFFIVHGKPPQRLLAGGLTVGVTLVSTALFYEPVVNRYGLDFNVDIHGKILDLEGRTEVYTTLHLDGCSRYEANPVGADYKGNFRIRANCSEQIVVTRIIENGKRRPCLTRTDSVATLPSGVVTFASLAQHREQPHVPYWGNYGEDKPYLLTCIWDPPRYRSELTGQFRNLVADGQVYPVRIRGSIRPRMQIVEDGDNAQFSMQWVLDQGGADGATTGKLILKGYNGGIQPTDDRFFNIAPADGYLDQFELDLGDMQTRTIRRFYFHRSNRHAYGALEIDYKPQSLPPLAIDVRLIASASKKGILAAPIKTNQK